MKIQYQMNQKKKLFEEEAEKKRKEKERLEKIEKENKINEKEKEIQILKQKQTENEKKISELLYITKKVNQNIQKNSSIEKKNNIETITPKNKDLKLNTETIKGNILKNENLTNPGILCEILYDENDIPMILNSQKKKEKIL